MKTLVDKLAQTHLLEKEELILLIDGRNDELAQYLFGKARRQREAVFGTSVYLRALIEITSYCKNDCLYCGLRRSNAEADRYRLDDDAIMDCCRRAYDLGLRTFVLQGGEDRAFDDNRVAGLTARIRRQFPDCAITLSIGEKSYGAYRRFFEAGADRYLLRHETANANHYQQLHPDRMKQERRLQCLRDLKQIGYQVGTGFMVGSPFQTSSHIAEDLLYMKGLRPQMVGIGPFIPHHATPFAREAGGTVELTLFVLGLIRLLLPEVLLPSTTALGSLSDHGCEMGLTAGANVVMPNVSPAEDRGKYMIYDHKTVAGAETAEGLAELARRIESAGMHVEQSRGDAPGFRIQSPRH